MLLIMFKYRIKVCFSLFCLGVLGGLFFMKRMSCWNCHANIIAFPAHLPFLSSCFSETHIKFHWVFFPLYFLPLNIVNQTLNTFKTYQSFESSWKTPYCALWIFKPFSLSYDKCVFFQWTRARHSLSDFPQRCRSQRTSALLTSTSFWMLGVFRSSSMNPGTMIFALEE